MKRFCCISSVIILIFFFTLFFSGEDLAESALTNQNNQKAVPLTWLSLLLGKKTGSNPGVCEYWKLGEGGYYRTCVDTSSGWIKTELEHWFGTSEKFGYFEGITITTYKDESNPNAVSTWVVWQLGGAPLDGRPCIEPPPMGPPMEYFVSSNINHDTGTHAAFGFLGNHCWPCTYSSTTQPKIDCWPNYDHPDECGTYVCPGLDSIKPVEGFPGNCHVWWDHYDAQGNFVECNY